ncbi:MAG: Holliday junction DNA helicase RuvB C-terminal domain-containing protein [Phycisphaerales bacterium]
MDESPTRTDINQVRPTSLSHIRGQPRVVKQLQLHLAAHFNMRWAAPSPPEFGPVILCGPPGTGKTLVAQALHAELGNLKFLRTNGVTLNKKPELYSVLLHADASATVFIDEAQGLKSQAQYILLTALSEKIVHVPGLASATNPYAVPLAPFTLILATTHEYLLQEALRDRMRIQCRFEYYTVEDLVEIVRQRAAALGWQYESEEVLQMIAQRAKATPRQALHRNLQTCWEVAVSHDRNIITIADAREAFGHLQIDELGLDGMDRRYLGVLAQGGPASLGALSAKLGLPALTIQRVVEPYLIRQDLVTKGKSSARILTEKGRRHLETTAWPIH